MAGIQATVTSKMSPAQYRAHAEAVSIAHSVAKQIVDTRRGRGDVTPLLAATGIKNVHAAARMQTEMADLDADFGYGLGLSPAM